MELTEIETLRALISAMRQAGASDLEIVRGNASVRLSVDQLAGPVVARLGTVQVNAQYSGILLLTALDGFFALPQPKERIENLAILAFLDVGGVLIAVRAPVAGRIITVHAEDKTSVDIGQPLFEIQLV